MRFLGDSFRAGSSVLAACAALGALAPAQKAQERVQLGAWRAWLDSPGGELSFGLELEQDESAKDGLVAHLRNGVERIAVPETRWEGEELVLDLEHYDAQVRARASEGGTSLDGEWTRRSALERWARLPFHARLTPRGAFPAPERPSGAASVEGRWAVDFASEEDPAVGIFVQSSDGDLSGTFLTALGDYRFLAGSFDGEKLVLSCFDGAHAFLFRAMQGDDGMLSGDFWSRDSFHDTWTAQRDAGVSLPDPFRQNRWREDVQLSDLRYPDEDHVLRQLDDPSFAGKARILQLFGTWCPNCHDEAPLLAELDRRYRGRGLSILALAFELTGDLERDAEQVKRFRKRHGVQYPILIAGGADKSAASERFPLLDRVKAYPTTIFLDRSGKPRAIHTGFSGPATGAEYDHLRERFEDLIEELLSEPAPEGPGGAPQKR